MSDTLTVVHGVRCNADGSDELSKPVLAFATDVTMAALDVIEGSVARWVAELFRPAGVSPESLSPHAVELGPPFRNVRLMLPPTAREPMVLLAIADVYTPDDARLVLLPGAGNNWKVCRETSHVRGNGLLWV
jgi:hypothetical protein